MRGDERRRLLVLAGLALAVCLAWAWVPSLGNGFAPIDDEKNFLRNAEWRGLGASQIRWMWTANHMGHFIPVTWLTLGLDYEIWGLDPFGLHLTSLLFHAANAGLVLALALRLGPGTAPGAAVGSALAAAIAFAAHPLRVESVAWASERRDVVCGFFSLLALLVYVAAARRDSWRLRWLAAVLQVLALLAKGIAVALPVALLAIDVALGRLPGDPRRWRGHLGVLREKAPFVVASAVGVATTLLAIRYVLAPLQGLGVPERLAAASFGLGFYLEKTLWPLSLPLVVPVRAGLSLAEPDVAPRAALALGCALAAALAARRWPVVAWAGLVYLAFVLPVSGLFQAGPQLVAHRYTYLSCLPWALLLGGGAALLGRRWPAAPWLLAGGLALGLAPATRAQAALWRDPWTFSRAAAAGAPTAVGPRYTLARLHIARGEWEAAARQLRAGVFHNPAAGALLNAQALLLATCPEPAVRSGDEAVLLAGRLLRVSGPDDPWALFTTAAALAEAGRPDAAAATARRGLAAARRQGDAEIASRLVAALEVYDAGGRLRLGPADWGPTSDSSR